MDDGGMRLELSKEKNHAGGIKDPYAIPGMGRCKKIDTSKKILILSIYKNS